jgi:hypothetical protein
MTKSHQAVPASRPSPTRRPPKARRARRHPTDQPPPEAAKLRDRAATHEPTFVEDPASSDAVVEQMGEDAVMAITTGEDESDDERRDGDAAIVREVAPRDDILFDDIDELAAEDDAET